jgi:hypothetical protein
VYKLLRNENKCKKGLGEKSNAKKKEDNVEDSFTAGCIIRTTPVSDAFYYVFYNPFLPPRFLNCKFLNIEV